MAQGRTRMIPAVILAGGASRRMGGGDKGLLPFGTSTVIGTVITRLEQQASPLAINANGDPARFAAFGLPVLPDTLEGQPGPLAGVLAAMIWAKGLGATRVVTCPSDTPLIPMDLVEQLRVAANDNRPAVAASDGRWHGTIALWPTHLSADLATDIVAGQRKVSDWLQRHSPAVASFDTRPHDPFLNINTPADLEHARTLL